MVCRLEVEWDWIVKTRLDPPLRQISLESIPLRGANDIKVINGLCPRRFMRKGEAFDVAKELVISRSILASLLVPLGKMLQFDAKDAGLDRIESAIVPLHIVMIFFRLPVIPEY